MIERLVAGVLSGGLMMLAGQETLGAEPAASYALVEKVTPVTRFLRNPRQVCRDVEVEYIRPQRQRLDLITSFVGAVLGGFLGNTIGQGDGRLIATVAGTAAGAYAGKEAGGRLMTSSAFTNIERLCENEVDVTEELIGYDVRYRIAGFTEATVRTNYDPGDQIPMSAGRVVLDGKTRYKK